MSPQTYTHKHIPLTNIYSQTASARSIFHSLNGQITEQIMEEEETYQDGEDGTNGGDD